MPDGNVHDDQCGGLSPGGEVSCMLKALPRDLQITAAQTAVTINPMNSPFAGVQAAPGSREVMGPLHIALLTQKKWGSKPRKLSVGFMESTPTDLRRRIVSHLNAWAKTSCVEFAE